MAAKVSPMSSKVKGPCQISVVRRGKTFTYQIDSDANWDILAEADVLKIKAVDGATYYWPLDSVTLWKVEPVTALSGHA